MSGLALMLTVIGAATVTRVFMRAVELMERGGKRR